MKNNKQNELISILIILSIIIIISLVVLIEEQESKLQEEYYGCPIDGTAVTIISNISDLQFQVFDYNGGPFFFGNKTINDTLWLYSGQEATFKYNNKNIKKYIKCNHFQTINLT